MVPSQLQQLARSYIDRFPETCGSMTVHASCASAAALSSVKDDHAFLWKHAIFRHLPSRNPETDQYEILHD
jgi:hypothetical protein